MRRFGLLLCGFFLLGSCGPSQGDLGGRRLPMRTVLLESGSISVPLSVETASSPLQVSRGLMFRTSLPQDRGMLFVSPTEEEQSFWMKNTLIPLDILFFTSSGDFVSSTTMFPCKEDPCPTYVSTGPARFALEVNAGFVKEHGIRKGWKLSME